MSSKMHDFSYKCQPLDHIAFLFMQFERIKDLEGEGAKPVV